ncbi:hypothetical protein K2X14_05810 [Acetobacter sp. TBRC 12305]|uniref:Uncharacterized protein n=1 Tax=Acetobacter garciniae TaxID=2817435 RepID=A0A939HNH3_9PROT|nr:hypothetical protein [Acetobacter garciniae]MBO1324667.1 hypothetical protein [Acetobacter garciniae]MBX0344356.1 hypothetical protein [Acetobacter garciniae]
MNSPELNNAFVDNIADLEAVAKRIQMLGEPIDAAINKITSDWADENGWSGQFDDDSWLLAPSGTGWYNPAAEDESGAYFEWANFEDQEEDNFYVTQLCQAGQDKLGLRFTQDLLGRAKWKKIFPELAELVTETGFLLEERNRGFFLPVKINPTVLAEGVGDDDLEAGLHQYRETLDQLARAKPVFDRLIARIKELAE